MSLSKRAGLIGSSPTLSVTAKARKMKQEGINVNGFGTGERTVKRRLITCKT